MFELILVADWSAARKPTRVKPSPDAIWICADHEGSRTTEYFRTRAAALGWIEGWLRRGHRTLLGLDFAFGYPPGFARTLTGTDDALAVWDWLAARIEDGPDNANNRLAVAAEMNRAFPGVGPLWGNGSKVEFADLPRLGTARTGHGLVGDRRTVDRLARGAQPVVKLSGAGSVGGQSLVGLAALAGLCRRHGLEVWPQQTGFAVPQGRSVLVEVFPSLFWTRPRKDRAPEGQIADREQVVATARALRAMPPDWFTAPARLPDGARTAREEGWILGMGPDGPLAVPASGQDAAADREDRPKRAALPPGVDWTSMPEALATLRRLHPCRVGAGTVPLAAAAGRVLAEPVAARRANPPRANAAVDGWGFARATIVRGPIPIAPGRAAAAPHPAPPVPAGQAIRILTGAPLPQGVDTVAMQEEARVEGGALHLRSLPGQGANTRPAGEDVAVGAAILDAGRRLTPGDLALAASAGHGALPVRDRLRVGVLSTGDELIAPGAAGDGTCDANRPMMLAMLAGWGLDPVDLGQAPDDPAALRAALDTAPTDAILTSGGASAGDEDHMARLLREGGRVDHWRIAIKPGRPLILGEWRGRAVFGLPGNPVAAFTCAALFARPALLQMAGAGWVEPAPVLLPAAFAKRKRSGRTEIYRARLRDGRVELFASEGSGRTSGLSWAEGFVVMPEPAAQIAPGDPVPYLAFEALGL